MKAVIVAGGRQTGRTLATVIARELTDRQVLIVGSDDANELNVALEAIGLSSINSASAFRTLVESMSVAAEFPTQDQVVPKFRTDRPYLKKKKGRS